MIPTLRHTFTVDASYNAKKALVGIGLVLQATDMPGRRGEILEMIAETHTINGPEKEMEKFAIFRAIAIATERGYRRVKVRSDCNPVRTQLKKDHKSGYAIERDDLHGNLLRLAKGFIEVQFGYCPRRKNQMAHRLARKGAQIQTANVIQKTT